MLEIVFLFVLASAWILFASIQDLRKREVANWVSFSLAIFALGFRFFYSLFYDSAGWGFFIQGVIGLGIFIILGNVLYYGRMFAGGDAKLMMAFGDVLGFSESFFVNLKIYVTFIFLFLLAGALYGLVATLRLSMKNFKAFKKDFIKRLSKNKISLMIIMAIGVGIIIFGLFESIFVPFGILVFVFPYLYFYARSVDQTCMVREVKVSEISEGEWLAQSVKVGNKTILSKWDGLSLEELRLIRKKYKTIKIKQGIPFVPVFLIAFLVLIYLWQSGLWNAFW